MSRMFAWLAGVVVLSGALTTMLLANVHADRGRDEINLLSIHELTVGSGDVLTQPVAMQWPAPSVLNLPYRWLGERPARFEARIEASDGSLLSTTTGSLANSSSPLWLQPTGDGSYWEHEQAAFYEVKLPANATGMVILRLTRLDQEPGALVLFASNAPSTQTNPLGGSKAELHQPLRERPGDVLDFETEYGASEPAFEKAPTFVSRVQSLAPPWLPFPVPVLLFGCMVALAIVCYSATIFWRESER